MKMETLQQLEALFRETGMAHHKAFIATNGDDPDWPLWYAEYLGEKLHAILGSSMNRSELAELLIKVEEERKALAPGSSWPAYYAHFLLTRIEQGAGSKR